MRIRYASASLVVLTLQLGCDPDPPGDAVGDSSRPTSPTAAPSASSSATPAQKVIDVELTLITSDYKYLSCAMEGAVAGKHCAFVSKDKPNPESKTDARSDANLLQPYTTTDRLQFLAAGLWVTPPLKDKLDNENWERVSPRFRVRCKLAVIGRAKSAAIQWKPREGWHPATGWKVGTLSDCAIE